MIQDAWSRTIWIQPAEPLTINVRCKLDGIQASATGAVWDQCAVALGDPINLADPENATVRSMEIPVGLEVWGKQPEVTVSGERGPVTLDIYFQDAQSAIDALEQLARQLAMKLMELKAERACP